MSQGAMEASKKAKMFLFIAVGGGILVYLAGHCHVGACFWHGCARQPLALF